MGHTRSKELTFVLTNRCNLNCTYCYPSDYKYAKDTLDIRFAKRAVKDFIRDDVLKIGLDKIRFFGIGEPTLEFMMLHFLL